MNDFTLIETEKFNELVEKVIKFDMGLTNTSVMYKEDLIEYNERLANFYKDYVTVPIELPQKVSDKVEQYFSKGEVK